MKLRKLLMPFASWAILSVVIGAAIGIVIGLGDTGHVGSLGTIVLLLSVGIIFGVVGGAIFAPVFTYGAAHLQARPLRVCVATGLGALCGLVGIFVADKFVGISHALTIGGVLGAIIGFVLGVRSDSEILRVKSTT